MGLLFSLSLLSFSEGHKFTHIYAKARWDLLNNSQTFKWLKQAKYTQVCVTIIGRHTANWGAPFWRKGR